MDIDELIQQVTADFRDRAETLRQDGCDERGAGIWTRAAEALEEQFHEWALEAVPLKQAAEETGYSYSALDKMERRGELEDVSEDGTRRVRRWDLPRKPNPPGSDAEPDLADLRLGRSG